MTPCNRDVSTAELIASLQSSMDTASNYGPVPLTPLLSMCVGKFMQLPMNRIRQIINLDPESSMFDKKALLVTAKATEAFI